MYREKSFMLAHNQLVEGNLRLSKRAKRRMEKIKADNTLRAYGADWNDFAKWCRFNNETALPAEPETVVNYINDLADYDVKANTISRRITAISENHIAAGYTGIKNPAKDNLVHVAMTAIRREKGTFQKSKAPVLIETLYLFADCFPENDLAALRDKALIFLGFAGAFRRSELVGIYYEDLTFTPQGLVIFIPKSKADQLGRGSTIAIPYAPDKKICAVHAVEEWLAAANITSGPIFRSFTSNHKLRKNGNALSDKAVALIVKKYAALAGFDPAKFAGHSLRRGFATSAAQHDVSVLSIMRQTRHRSEKMVHRYIEQGDIFKENPLNRIYNSRY